MTSRAVASTESESLGATERRDEDARLLVLSALPPFPRVTLVNPSESGFILVAAEVDRRSPFLAASRRKRQVIADCKRLSGRLQNVAA